MPEAHTTRCWICNSKAIECVVGSSDNHHSEPFSSSKIDIGRENKVKSSHVASNP